MNLPKKELIDFKVNKSLKEILNPSFNNKDRYIDYLKYISDEYLQIDILIDKPNGQHTFYFIYFKDLEDKTETYNFKCSNNRRDIIKVLNKLTDSSQYNEYLDNIISITITFDSSDSTKSFDEYAKYIIEYFKINFCSRDNGIYAEYKVQKIQNKYVFIIYSYL